jgi:hypothetical protein
MATRGAEAKLSRHLVVYLDILGLREAMASARPSMQDSRRLLRSYVRGLRLALEVITPDKDERDDPLGWKFKIFTDNVVLGIPVWTDDAEHEFGLAASQIARFQLLLALSGWFVRGGVAIGPLYFDDQVLFGPALAEAYELEQKVARDPRVVLSARVARLVTSHLDFYAEPFFAPQNGYVLIDTDDTMFLNYLYEPIGSGEEDMTIDFLKRHRRIVERRLKENIARPQIWAKYRWVATYHNFFWVPIQKVSGPIEAVEAMNYDESCIAASSRAGSPRALSAGAFGGPPPAQRLHGVGRKERIGDCTACVV